MRFSFFVLMSYRVAESIRTDKLYERQVLNLLCIPIPSLAVFLYGGPEIRTLNRWLKGHCLPLSYSPMYVRFLYLLSSRLSTLYVTGAILLK